jgi:uncharacterized membrane protein
MKLVYGLIGAGLLTTFLASFVLKIKEPAMMAVVLVGLVMAFVDLWQARNETNH